MVTSGQITTAHFLPNLMKFNLITFTHLWKTGHMWRLLLIVLFVVALVYPFVNRDVDVPEGDSERAKTTLDDKKTIEKPLHNVILPNFAAINDVKEKKHQFFSFLRPTVIAENQRILAVRAKVLLIADKLESNQPLTTSEETLFNKLVVKYKLSKNISSLKKIDELISRVNIVPTALVLVQAANESAWGTSRFARIGLNFFGIWCYKKGCGMVPNSRDADRSHEVAAFSSLKLAVQHYVHNINTNNAYSVFRTIRKELEQHHQPITAEILATGLLPYSERGIDYVLEISDMLRHNEQYIFD